MNALRKWAIKAFAAVIAAVVFTFNHLFDSARALPSAIVRAAMSAARAVAEAAYLFLTRLLQRQGLILCVTGPLTLIEAAKLETGDEYRRAIIELYAGSSAILQVLPFEDIEGNAIRYNEEAELPGVGFRGVNEGYIPSIGIINPRTESLVIAGGDLDVDKFIVDTMGGEQQRSVQEEMKVRALALMWTKKFFKGDSLSQPREFDGLQTRVTGNQLISAGSTANGAALSLAVLDEAIDNTMDPNFIVMNRKLARRLTTAAKNPDVAGNIQWTPDAFGRRMMVYNGLPVLTVDLDGAGAQILGFDEAAASGTATATSIYILSVGPGRLTGIQNGGVDVRDLGELETAPVYRTRVEWYNGLMIMNGRSVTRIRHVGDLAFTA
jgi:hypothetical protein